MPVSTPAILDAVRARVLAYTPPSGATLASLTGSRVYRGEAVSNAGFPFVVLRLIGAPTTADTSLLRQTPLVEAHVFTQKNQTVTAETIADRLDQALLGYVDRDADTVGTGLLFATSRERASIPAGQRPTERDTPAVRCVYRLVAWPDYLVTVT